MRNAPLVRLFRLQALAATATATARAPAPRSILAASFAEAPVVRTSSTSSTVRPATRRGRCTETVPLGESSRADRGREAWGGGAPTLRRTPSAKGSRSRSATSAARRAGGPKPRFLRASLVEGKGTRRAPSRIGPHPRRDAAITSPRGHPQEGRRAYL